MPDASKMEHVKCKEVDILSVYKFTAIASSNSWLHFDHSALAALYQPSQHQSTKAAVVHMFPSDLAWALCKTPQT